MKPLLRLVPVLALSLVLSGAFAVIPSGATTTNTTDCSSWIRLIDVSSNNVHPIGWQELVKSGIAGVYIKNSDGINYVNNYWKSDANAAQKAGMPWGSYYFAQPLFTNPVQAANFFVKSGGANGQLPPALDLERDAATPTATVKWALAWLDRVRYLTNRTPIIYTGAFQPWSASPAFSAFDLWLPAYPLGYAQVKNVCALLRPSLPASWKSTGWTIWQYTSVGHPAGTGNNTDVSVALTSWWQKWTGAGTVTTKSGNVIPAYSTGSYGAKVSEIQRLLVAHKLLAKVDGVFGITTKHAVEAWQAIIGVTADGVWSVATQTASDFYLKNHYTLASSNVAKAMAKHFASLISLEKVVPISKSHVTSHKVVKKKVKAKPKKVTKKTKKAKK